MRDKNLYLRSLFPEERISKSQESKFKIIQTAIRCYAKFGYDHTTFEVLARESKLSRPLVMHYFASHRDIMDFCMRYIRVHFQEMAIQAIQQQSKSQKQLEAYIDCTIRWVDEFSDHARVWMLLFYYAAIDAEVRSGHTQLAAIGHQRIVALLNWNKIPKKDLQARAKLVQNMISGLLVALITEDLASLREKLIRESKKNIIILSGYSQGG